MTDKYIPRTLEATIREASQYFPVITVTGPRQSGKTTMLRHMFAQLPYYSLEDLDTREFAMQDPLRFLQLNANGMILDEVQNVPHLLSYIQGVVDNQPDRRFILSGSSNFTLLRNVTQSLAGRTGVFELLPLSLKEVADEAYTSDVDRLLYNGLYPAVYKGANIPRFIYPAYIKTYLEKDIRSQLAIKDLTQFNTFLRLCANRIGSEFNATALANEVGVTSKTIQAWTSILQASYVVYLMPPYYENTRKRLIKSPKIYFCDTGLACALLGIEQPENLAFHPMRGHLFENLIVTEMLKRRLNEGKEPNIYFYRDSNQNEIDILQTTPEGLHAIEVKSAMTYSPNFEKVLLKTNSLIKSNIARRTIVYTGQIESHNSGGIDITNFRHFDCC